MELAPWGLRNRSSKLTEFCARAENVKLVTMESGSNKYVAAAAHSAQNFAKLSKICIKLKNAPGIVQ